MSRDRERPTFEAIIKARITFEQTGSWPRAIAQTLLEGESSNNEDPNFEAGYRQFLESVVQIDIESPGQQDSYRRKLLLADLTGLTLVESELANFGEHPGLFGAQQAAKDYRQLLLKIVNNDEARERLS